MSKLNVDQKTIKDLFQSKKSDFLIPDYQRPYAWGEAECRTLWDDIFSFAIPDEGKTEFDSNSEYFLAAGQNHFIRLERLHVNKPKRDDEILIDGVIENIEYYGLYIKYYIDVGSQILKAIEKNDGINIYAPGEKVTVAMKPTDVMSYDAQ